MNENNLIQNRGGLTPEEARENGRKGGLASGVARRKRRQMRDVLSNILTVEITEPTVREALEAAGLPPTHEAAICYAAVARAATGDIEACRFVRDTLGEKPNINMGVGTITIPVGKSLDALDLSQYTDEELEALATAYDDETDISRPCDKDYDENW